MTKTYVLTRDPLEGYPATARLFETLASLDPALAPIAAGSTEPLIPIRDEAALKKIWDWPFHWKAQWSDGGLTPALNPFQRGSIGIDVDDSHTDVSLPLLTELTLTFDAEWGFAHEFTGNEDDAVLLFANNPNFRSLRQTGLPYVYWATTYGRTLSEFLGRDRLLTAPVETVSETAAGHTIVQLTASPADPLSEIESARTAFLDHVGREAFQLRPVDPPAAIPAYDDIRLA